MAKHLIVTGAFGSYRRGDRIEDPEAVEAALESNRRHVVPIVVEDLAPEAAAKAPAPALATKPAAPAAPPTDDPGAIG